MSREITAKQPDEVSIGGIVLCGGKSSRMGSPKAWLEFGNERLLQRVVRILSAVVDPIVVVAAQDQELPDLNQEIEIVEDEFPGRGPLSGIYSGLNRLAERRVDFAYVTACDCPFLKTGLVQFLIDQLDGDCQIVLIDDGKFKHVLSAIYSTAISGTAKSLMAKEQFRPLSLTDFHSTKSIGVDDVRPVDEKLESLVNLNSPSDYQAAISRLQEPGAN